MGEWAEKSMLLKGQLSLSSDPIGFKRFEKASDLEKVEGLVRWKQNCVFCQIPFMARVGGFTVGLTNEDKVGDRCKRIHGLQTTGEKEKLQEAKLLSRTWMPSVEEGLKQQEDYPRIPPGEAIVVGPLIKDNFEPDVALFYGNPAQIMMLMCGLQKVKYERFHFHFIGEGASISTLSVREPVLIRSDSVTQQENPPLPSPVMENEPWGRLKTMKL
jgi:uncharacterized protein (DUF169 family)